MLVIGKDTLKEDELVNPVELTKVTDGRTLDDLIKVTSSRNCNVFKINEDLFLTAVKDEYYKDSLISNFSQRKRYTDALTFQSDILPIHDVISQDGKVFGYTTDSFDTTLKDYFITEDPSLMTTRIILRLMGRITEVSNGHGDIDLNNYVLKNGRVFLTNYMMKRMGSSDDFAFLNDIEREILAFYGHPTHKNMPVDEADHLAFNYWYYLLINTYGNTRKELIEAGMDNIYKNLFEDVPNVNLDEKAYKKAQNGTVLKKEYGHDGRLIQHFFITTLQ